MKNVPMYSILIPVYNTSKYLRQCLDSVLKQEIDDYEVIIVNDGSTDNSLEICNEYASIDSRFTVINQKNKGLLLTRRVGINYSKGNFLLFLDSDDFWQPDTLTEINSALFQYNYPDIIIFGINKVDNGGRFLGRVITGLPYGIITENRKYKDTILKILVSTDNLNSLCTKVIKREIVDVENDYSSLAQLSLGEDLLQSIPLIISSKNILFIEKYLYNYRSNTQSITNNFSLKSFRDIAKVRERLLDELKVHQLLTDEIHVLFNNRNLHIILSILNRISISRIKYKEKRSMLTSIIKDPFFKDVQLNYKKVKLTKHTLLPKIMLALMTIRVILPIVILLKLRYLFVSPKK